jgi:hypothetical protein
MRPRPQFGTINERLVPIGTLDYQAFQASWNKRLTSGIHVQPGERRAVAGGQHHRDLGELRHGGRNAVERSTLRADCVQADFLNASD